MPSWRLGEKDQYGSPIQYCTKVFQTNFYIINGFQEFSQKCHMRRGIFCQYFVAFWRQNSTSDLPAPMNFQNEKRHSSLLQKAFQISSNYFLPHIGTSILYGMVYFCYSIVYCNRFSLCACVCVFVSRVWSLDLSLILEERHLLPVLKMNVLR